MVEAGGRKTEKRYLILVKFIQNNIFIQKWVNIKSYIHQMVPLKVQSVVTGGEKQVTLHTAKHF